MPCPVHNSDDDDGRRTDTDDGTSRAERSQIERRAFMKSALVIGGSSALSSVTSLYGMPETAAAAVDPVSVADRENRQHAWDRWETYLDAHQQTVPPGYHLVLLADYDHEGEPQPRHRRRVADAFDQIEEAFEWSHDGVMFTVGYSLEYFRRYDENLPPGLDPELQEEKPGLLSAADLIGTEGVTLDREDPTADTHDVCLHMASDNVQNLLAVEAALWGDRDEVNGVAFDASLQGILTEPQSYPERRVGFVGREALEEEGGAGGDGGVYPDDIPESSDLSMGFNDQYRNSVPRETDATILEDQKLVDPKPPGAFAQGTVQHVSKIDINLTEATGDREGGWYDDHDLDERRQLMLSPDHTAENTGEVGENLGNSTAPGDRPMRAIDYGKREDVAERTEDHANDDEVNRVGHAQKVARARFDLSGRLTDEGQTRLSDGDEILPGDSGEDTAGTDGEPYEENLRGHGEQQVTEQVILRRDVDTVDQDTPGNHFVALMRFAPYMVYMRRAMNDVPFDTDQFGLESDGDGFVHEGSVPEKQNGIVPYLTTQRRGNFLVPPITLRALPFPRADQIDVTVTREDGAYHVETGDLGPDQVDQGTMRFGWFYDVNRGRGAAPDGVSAEEDGLVALFPADETGIDAAPGGPDGEEDVRLRLFAKRPDSRRPVRATASLEDVDEN